MVSVSRPAPASAIALDPAAARHGGRESQRTTIGGEILRIPEGDGLVHLQFRRFAGCPVCDLHLHSFVRRHDELARAGIREVVVFHSTRDDVVQYQADLPFAVVADADKRLYRDFGVESSPRALLDPRAWYAIVRGIVHSVGRILGERHPIPAGPTARRIARPTGGFSDRTGRANSRLQVRAPRGRRLVGG